MHGRRRLHKGILHMFAGECFLTWPEIVTTPGKDDFVAVNKEQLYVAPRFVGSTAANTLFCAVDSAAPGLDWERIVSTQNVKLVVLSFGGDLDSGNVRLKCEYIHRAQDHRTRCPNLAQSYGPLSVIFKQSGLSEVRAALFVTRSRQHAQLCWFMLGAAV